MKCFMYFIQIGRHSLFNLVSHGVYSIAKSWISTSLDSDGKRVSF